MAVTGDDPATLYAPYLAALPISGVSISTLGDPFGSQTVSASDAVAARLDEIQLDLGEGPSWDAVQRDHPVLIGDVLGTAKRIWPGFANEIARTSVRSVFAFPLRIGALRIGAVDLYDVEPGDLHADCVEKTDSLTTATALEVLRRELSDDRIDDGSDDEPYSRRVVHQATGMVLVQLGVSAEDALLVIRGHAFSSDKPVRQVAADIVARRLDLSATDGGAR